MCRSGETVPGTTTETLERDGQVVVIRSVPAEVCGPCGHGITSAATTERVFELAEALLGAGVEVGVREYQAA
jgi:YgiT-type zinc finger domain-containing protein